MELKDITSVTWEAVFVAWQERESRNPAWIQCAHDKGWKSWQAWRGHTAQLLDAPAQAWQRAVISDPARDIPAMLLGPFQGWQSRVKKTLEVSFGELLADAEQEVHFRGHDAVISIMKGLPFETELIGYLHEETGQMICLDGHHRACAITLAARDDKRIAYNDQITIAYATVSSEMWHRFSEVLNRGTGYQLS